MKSVLIATLFLLFLLFGCFHDPAADEPLPVVPVDSETPDTNASDGVVTDNRTVVVIENTTAQPAPGGDPSSEPLTPDGLPFTPGYTETPQDKFAIYFINVGMDELQGDAILIKKGDFDMLVDAGNTRSIGTVVNFLKGRGVDDLEVLVSTHADNEHYGGIAAISDEFAIEEFWWGGKLYGDAEYDSIVRLLNDKNVTIKEVRRGDIERFNGIDVMVLNPSDSNSFGDRDNDAIVLKVTQEQFCLLLTSDILGGGQSELLNDPAISVRCNVMQVPFHGLGRGTTSIGPFLLRVAPRDVIFSGSISDPAPDRKGTRYTMYDKLNSSGIKYYENYRSGTVRITSDGVTYVIDSLGE